MSTSQQEHFVYHVTTASRAEQCLVDGILPRHTTLASSASTALDAAYDNERPPHISERERAE